MKRAGIGLSFAAALGLIACASEDLDQPPPDGTAGRGAGGSHAGGRGGSSPTGTPGGQANSSGGGHTSQGGTTGSIGGTSSNNAGMPGVGGLVGTSGSVGLGGSGGNAGSGGSSPVFESGTCASTPSMSLGYQQASNNPKQISALYQFSNTTDTPIPLAQLKIRYFFSNEETSGWSTTVHDAKLDGGTLGYKSLMGETAIVVSPLGTTVPGADSYIELSFSSALTIDKGAIGTVNWDLQPHVFTPPDQDQTNDYSYNAKAVAFTVWDHVVIYQGNTLVWGCTPKEAGGSGGSGGVGGSGVGGSAGALGGSAGTSGSGTSGTDNGGASSGGLGGTAGANAGTGGDATNGGGESGGTGGASGAAGSNLGGANGSSGAGGSQPSGGSGGSPAGSGGSSGSN